MKEEFTRKVGSRKKVILSQSLTKTLRDDFGEDISEDEVVYERRHMSPFYNHISRGSYMIPLSYEGGLSDIYHWQLDIKNITRKLKKLKKEDKIYSYLESIVYDHINQIMDIDPINGLIATTNAIGWGIDEFTIEKIVIDESEVNLEIRFSATPTDHLEDKLFCGDQLEGTLDANIDDEGNLVFTNIQADLNF